MRRQLIGKGISAIGKLSLAAAAILGSTQLTSMGHDFGFRLVQTFAPVSTTEGNAQYSGAQFLQWIVVPAIAAAFAVGFLTRNQRVGKRGNLGIFAALLALFASPLVIFRTLPDLDTCGYIAVMSVSATAFSIPLRWLYKELQLRSSGVKLAVALLPALLCALLLQWDVSYFRSVMNTWWSEAAVYCVLIAISSGLCARLIGAKNNYAAISSAFFCTLPITVFNIANIVFTISCLLTHSEISWRAFVSALAITSLTAAACAGGAVLGARFPKRAAA